MKNAMQLKAVVKNLSKEKRISAQLVLQNYMLERFLERVSYSSYSDSFILKGGFLIASMVGLDSRATMDMDATIKGFPVNEDTVLGMIKDIIAVPVEDGISFRIRGIKPIREEDEYQGFRVALFADYETMSVPLKLDITTGDMITPREIKYSYKLMLEDRNIDILAYNLSTLLAEKLETIISRGDLNTRPRDYYDVFILTKLYSESIEIEELKDALYATAEKRGTLELMKHFEEIIQNAKVSAVMKRQWDDYKKDFNFASEIEWEAACNAGVNIMRKIIQ